MSGLGYEAGDRIVVIGVMADEPDPMEVGARGTVTKVNVSPYRGCGGQLWVDWDNGRTLNILIPEDLAIIRKV